MCGIAGIYNFNRQPAKEGDIRLMMKIMKHRGPDDEGVLLQDNFALGHVRLSILDLSKAGHQPMVSNDGRYTITFNGEIYNYIELKKELESKYSFKTRTDTEVILAAYQEWGIDCLDKFNGDWAFIIYDKQENKFIGARDRYGIKPFYYYKNNDSIIFASEVKSIVPLLKERIANEKLIFEYLVYNRTDQYLETFFQGVDKLKHGHYFIIENNKFSIHQWYNLADKIQPADLSDEEYREELKSSINFRLRSDVPVGISLSGGIDSSCVTSILIHDFNRSDIHTFSSVYGKQSWADESNFIDLYKDDLSNMHYTFPDADAFYNDFKKFISAQCEPVSTIGPYGQFKVMELAAKDVTVTLDGQGADEMLAGYHNFFGAYYKELITKFRIGRFLSESGSYIAKHKSAHAFNYTGFYFLPLKLQKKVGSKLYGSVNNEFFNRLLPEVTIAEHLYKPKSLNDSLMQHFEYKLEHLLKWDDLNSLNFSIESRVPFLDHNLVEKTLSLPPHRKIYKATTKHILRESVKDILPQPIYGRVDKKGFSTPANEWFKSPDFKAYIRDMLNSSNFNSRGIFNVPDCNRKYQLHVEGKADHTRDIWKWINIHEWFTQFIEN